MIPSGLVSELVFTQESVWVTAWKNHLVSRESVDKTSSKKTPRHGCCLLCSHRQQTATVCQVLMAHSHYQGILSCASQELLSLLSHMLAVTKRFSANNNIGKQLCLLPLASGCSLWLPACKQRAQPSLPSRS